MAKDPTIAELFDLTGKTALVTGAVGYLGKAFAAALAEAGASVVCSSRDAGKAREFAAMLPVKGSAKHHGVGLDHMDLASLSQGFADAVKAGGKLDILVTSGHESCPHDWTNVTPEEFDRHLRNATGCFELSRKLREHVVGRKAPGSVIFIGSMYGVVASYPDVYEGMWTASPVAYHCLKGGIIHMTRHLAAYWAKDNVRVNCISPGPFPDKRAPDGVVQRLNKKLPMGRMGLPHELKGATVLLASDAGSYMTGQNIIIDGGWTAW